MLKMTREPGTCLAILLDPRNEDKLKQHGFIDANGRITDRLSDKFDENSDLHIELQEVCGIKKSSPSNWQERPAPSASGAAGTFEMAIVEPDEDSSFEAEIAELEAIICGRI
ncbi:hypothetical protein FJU08_21770 [Martelella alba]|uniref:Uncharacterized protein n=2 Tax=Martelella alba TaxID=2590451 RepID=A0A506TXF2_9HYPH|nr:hypothetical protein FJU08_21770 [Martelella alba]